MNWHELGGDPTPGDVDAVLRVARAFDETGAESQILVTRLRAIGRHLGPECWRGPAAQEFQRLLARLEPSAVAMNRAYDSGADAVQSYATALTEAQNVAAAAAADAGRAISERDTAQHDWHQAQDAVLQLSNSTQALRTAIGTAEATRAAAIAAGQVAYVAILEPWLADRRDELRRAEADTAEARNQQSAAMQRLTGAMLALSAARAKADSARASKDEAARQLVIALTGARPGRGDTGSVGRADAGRVRSSGSGDESVAEWVGKAFGVPGAGIGEIPNDYPSPFVAIAKKILRAADIVQLIRDGLSQYWDMYMNPSNHNLSDEERTARAGGAAAASMLYAFLRDILLPMITAAIGGVAGSAIPVLGTALGAMIGAGIGSIGSTVIDHFDDKLEKWVSELGTQGGSAIYDFLRMIADPAARDLPGAADTNGSALGEARTWA